MRLRTDKIRKTTEILDIITAKYKQTHPKKKRNWRTYEQRVKQRLATAFGELRELVYEATSFIAVTRYETRGLKPKLTLEQKVLVLLLKHLIGKSNRNMALMLILFSWVSNIEISYKSIERLYSDDLVRLALFNLHTLLLNKKQVISSRCSGDGTGYSLTVSKHYSTFAQKLKEKAKISSTKRKKQFVYSFTIMDLDSRLYIGYGTSLISEKRAYFNAVKMIQKSNVSVKSLRLDRYFSNQADIKYCKEELACSKVFFIPKSDVTVRGSPEWKQMLKLFVQNTELYLKEYFQRNNSESAFAEDKRRIGWKLGQKRPDRINTANNLSCLWHNIYWLG